MRIINATGDSMDTRVIDDTGVDITPSLKISRITIDITAEKLSRVTIVCEAVELDVVGDLLPD